MRGMISPLRRMPHPLMGSVFFWAVSQMRDPGGGVNRCFT